MNMNKKRKAFAVELALVLLFGVLLLASPQIGAAAPVECPALAPPSGATETVSNEEDLRDRAYSAAAGTTILIQAGTYNMTDFVQVAHGGVTLRGATGDRDDVVLDFGGMVGGHYGVQVVADDVTIADLTIRRANDHGVDIQGYDNPLLYNLHIYDIGDQLVKVNPGGDGSDDGVLACSRLEYTTTAPDDYTNGISAHNAHNWTVRDNEWYRIRGIADETGPAILFWSGSTDTVVERNLLVDCYQGIAFGNSSHTGVDHSGGIVRNNVIYGSLPHDVGIEMVHAAGNWLVAHNTVLLLNPSPGLTWGIEARYSESVGTFAYNLTNMDIWEDRDGAGGTLLGNVTDAQSSWFVNPAAGDLHLLGSATDAIDRAASLAAVTDDFDGDSRPIGSAPDVGADEYGLPAPSAVNDLRVESAVEAGGVLTVTLRWTAPANAFTTTIRYGGALITDANWDSGTTLTDTLPGSEESFTAVIPYGGGTVYFALKTQNEEGTWSPLSNNAFWPHIDTFVPVIMMKNTP